MVGTVWIARSLNYKTIFSSVDEFILVEKAVGSLTKVGIKRNEKGLFDDWKLALVS